MTLHCLYLENLPIFDQLLLEEALLREDRRNWCIVNQGSSPAIVMGISGKPHELIDTAKVNGQIPIIKRFSGGGTVIVDENTFFVTFIFQKEAHCFACYPEPILQWSKDLYQNVFHKDFSLRENDYVFNDRKFGGNAQYIKKDRWLLHTSFLWDYEAKHMDYLLHPKKTPNYRNGRHHLDFLCRLKDHFPSKDALLEKLKKAMSARYQIQEVAYSDVQPILDKNFRQTTAFVGTNAEVR